MPIETHLNQFREAFPSTKVLQEDNHLLYVFKTFFNASKTACEANMLIEKLELPLVAIHYASNSFFVVKSNETPDI